MTSVPHRRETRPLPDGIYAIAMQQDDELVVYVSTEAPDAVAETAYRQTLAEVATW